MTKTTEERRHTPRIETHCLVKFRPLSEPVGQWQLATLRDLGAGGAGFTHAERYPLGTPLELQLLLPTITAPLRAIGRICWVRASSLARSQDYGVVFEELSPPQREEITRLVEFYRRTPSTA